MIDAPFDAPFDAPLNEPFNQIVGQEQAIALLKAAIRRDRIAPAYLFAGASGAGRSKTASAFAQVLLGEIGRAHV
jgi:DNA polymerase-3 subunit delta'